jgi:uncharacterized membrane protein YtjA (UPF0391 family)
MSGRDKSHRYLTQAEPLPNWAASWPASSEGKAIVLEFAYFFFALAVIAALLGFMGLVGVAAFAAKVLCLAFLGLFIVASVRRHRRL